MKTSSLLLSVLLFAGCQNIPVEQELYPVQSPYTDQEIGKDNHADYCIFIQLGDNQKDAFDNNIKQIDSVNLPHRIIKKQFKSFDGVAESWILVQFLIPKNNFPYDPPANPLPLNGPTA